MRYHTGMTLGRVRMRLRWLSILVACLACALGAARAEIIPYGDVLYVYPGETAAEPNLTLRLRDALDVMGILLLDHLVIADDDYVSMNDSGYLRRGF